MNLEKRRWLLDGDDRKAGRYGKMYVSGYFSGSWESSFDSQCLEIIRSRGGPGVATATANHRAKKNFSLYNAHFSVLVFAWAETRGAHDGVCVGWYGDRQRRRRRVQVWRWEQGGNWMAKWWAEVEIMYSAARVKYTDIQTLSYTAEYQGISIARYSLHVFIFMICRWRRNHKFLENDLSSKKSR